MHRASTNGKPNLAADNIPVIIKGKIYSASSKIHIKQQPVML